MKWTKDRPKREGIYWFRDPKYPITTRLVRVFRRSGGMAFNTLNVRRDDPVSRARGCEWSDEPIPMPEEP